MRIGQFCVEYKTEVWTVFHFFVSYFNCPVNLNFNIIHPIYYEPQTCSAAITFDQQIFKFGLALLSSYLPFLIKFRPSKGSRTGSTVSPMFSNRTVCPLLIAFSIVSKYPFCPNRMTCNLSPYFCFIHFTPCN